ncbi:MAG TPA: hypothetical protein VGH14_07490 [Solirubrobacterales bacterium]
MKLPSIKRTSPPADERIPRGAIIVVAIGLLATLAAALLTTEKGSGEWAHLEFVQQAKVPNSKAVLVPGSKDAKMQLVDGGIQATGTNVAGYALFRVVSRLKIDEGAPIGEGRIVCSINAPGSTTEIARSNGGLRMLYPRSSEGIYGQEIPTTLLANFSSHGSELAELEEVREDLPEHWSTIKGVKLEWPKFEEGTEHLDYFLPAGKAKTSVVLPFYTVWKSTKVPKAQIACRLEIAAGKATVETEASLPRISPPIDEEAEELKQEEREENGETAEEEPEGE